MAACTDCNHPMRNHRQVSEGTRICLHMGYDGDGCVVPCECGTRRPAAPAWLDIGAVLLMVFGMGFALYYGAKWVALLLR